MERRAAQGLSTFLEGAQGGIGVLTGSLPVGVPVEIYGDLVARLREREALAVVDAKGPMLAHALPHQPFLIKPNRYELEMLCGHKLPSLSAVVKEGRRLQQQGVTYICVSLGGEGAIQVGPRNIYHVKVPQVQVRSTVGAGPCRRITPGDLLRQWYSPKTRYGTLYPRGYRKIDKKCRGSSPGDLKRIKKSK